MARTHGGYPAALNIVALAGVGASLDALLARPSCALLGGDDEPVVVAHSGGADSTALLALACRAGRPVHAVHIDHGLRAGSASEAASAVAAATRLGAATARSVRVAVATGGNVEERARDARHRALECARLDLGAATVLLGHTLDDQAETVLLAVLRGSSLPGLAGMPARRGAIARPLLDVRRSETHAVCAALDIEVIDDPTNHDRRLDRAWLRHELLPALSARRQRDVAPALARQAARIAEESDFLDRAAAAALLAAGDPPSARSLARLDRVILRRALRRFVGPPWIGGEAVDAAVAVVMGAAPCRRAAARPHAAPSRRPADGGAHAGAFRYRAGPVTEANPERGLLPDPHIARVVVSEAELRERVESLGKEITADYADRPPLLVGVLKGAFMFMADLARAIDLPVELDFMAVSSYGSATSSSGVVRIVKDLDVDLSGRHVLIVEDIIDSGLTLQYLRRYLAARGPASVEVCALLLKEGLQKVDPNLRYVGFAIPPEFVIGYGLDVDERYRNLPYVAQYRP